jgi:hypothetical protein
MINGVIPIPEETAIPGAKPHGSAPVLKDRPDLFLTKSIRRRVVYEGPGMPPAQSLISAYPYVVASILEETPYAEMGQPLCGTIVVYPFGGDAI